MRVLEASLAARVEAILGDRLVAVQPVERGYSSTGRWLVRGRTGTTAFAKIGSTRVAEKNLRREAALYERLHLPCMPEVLGWDAASPPILVLSDLSGNSWPPPWTTERVDRVIRAIESVHSAKAPLPEYADIHDPSDDWWGRIAADPEPFLRLRVASPDWLRRNLEALAASARGVSTAGTAVTHFDLRSDNISFSSTGAYLVDWSHACIGSARLDLGLFLPGLAAEGGPTPEAVSPAQPGVASWVTGFFAWHVEAAHPDGSGRPRDAAAPPGGGPPLGDARARPGAAGKVRSDRRARFTNTPEWKQPASFLARGRQA